MRSYCSGTEADFETQTFQENQQDLLTLQYTLGKDKRNIYNWCLWRCVHLIYAMKIQ